jgi:hypothetical protein
MANALDAIRAKLQAQENKSEGRSKGDGLNYPFWNIQEGETAVIRFLPDADTDNTFFWVEKQMIKLTFSGIEGQDSKPFTLPVPCGELYGDTCPVLKEVRPWFNDKSLEEMGRKYWKKRSYIFQGLVTENPLDEESPENPIRKFMIGPQIFNLIKGALMDPDMENIPTDYVNGTDFRLTKGNKGGYSDYGTSKWARKERALTEEELAAIDEHGLHDLKSFLPERPTAAHYDAIAEMFEASVNGEAYDPARWANFYKPYNLDVGTSTQETVAPVSKPAPKKAEPVVEAETEEESAPWEEEKKEAAPAKEASSKSPDDILAMIRNRKTAES